MTIFAYELGAVIAAQQAACPGSSEGAYALPWYLVVGSPGTGRTATIKELNQSWPRGSEPVNVNVPDALCTYWIPEKALYIEPGPQLMGPSANKSHLYELCEELKLRRTREPLDGIVLVISLERLADATEHGVGEYATELRKALIQINQGLGADVPVYVVATGLETLWGFGDVYQWTAERRDEEPWGFNFPPALPESDAAGHVEEALEGVTARMEAMCFARLSTEDPPDRRIRAFQHLSELKSLLGKLTEVMKTLAMSNSFERAPWLRAMVIGSRAPGTGHQLRHHTHYFNQFGLSAPAQSATPFPGGVPIYPYLDYVLLPERDLVPTRVRWRDDKLTLALAVLAVLLWLALIVVGIVRLAS